MTLRSLAIFVLCLQGARAASVPRRRQDSTVPPGTVSDCTYFVDATASDTCDSIASLWGITTAQFVQYNPSVKSDCSGLVVGDSYCVEENYGFPPTTTVTTSSGTVTIPASTSPTVSLPSPTQSGLISTCTTFYKVPSGATCQGIVDQYGTFSLSDFYTWNPAVGNTCLGLQANVYVCVGVSGTPTSKPSSRPATTTTTSGAPVGPPTATGITKDCKAYYLVASGDSCSAIVTKYGTFTLAQFLSWNAAIDSSCSNLQAGVEYCVGVSTTPTSKPTTTGAPSPTQTGIISTCNKFAKSNPGGSCSVFPGNHGISTAQLYAWNSVLGYHGEHCSTAFLANEYYCTGVSGPLPAPGPVQAGVIDTCISYAIANSGGTCPAFASRIGISLAQLYAWNPVLGTNGQNCQTSFWANTYYCTAVAG